MKKLFLLLFLCAISYNTAWTSAQPSEVYIVGINSRPPYYPEVQEIITAIAPNGQTLSRVFANEPGEGECYSITYYETVNEGTKSRPTKKLNPQLKFAIDRAEHASRNNRPRPYLLITSKWHVSDGVATLQSFRDRGPQVSAEEKDGKQNTST